MFHLLFILTAQEYTKHKHSTADIALDIYIFWWWTGKVFFHYVCLLEKSYSDQLGNSWLWHFSIVQKQKVSSNQSAA